MLIAISNHFSRLVRAIPKTVAGSIGALIGCSALAVVLTLGLPGGAWAARVSGTLIGTPQQPDTGRRFHFQDRITGDIFIVPIGDDGSFALNLPPGKYDLRAQHGVMVWRNIVVGDHDVTLGKFQEHPPNAISRVLAWQSLFPSLLTSPAPSAAYLFTLDPTVLPPETLANQAEALKPVLSPPGTEAASMDKPVVPVEKPVAPEVKGMYPMGGMAPMPSNGPATMTPQPAAPSNK